MTSLHRLQLEPMIARALEEDWGQRDWTTDLCVPADRVASAKIIAKTHTLVAGLEVAKTVFSMVDSTLKISCHKENGEFANPQDIILKIEGNAQSILKAERVTLNFFAKLCGIATLTRKFVEAIEGSTAQLLDTRKSTPGLRILEKAATSIGGARNHRLSLTDGAMVKENHIRAAGSITLAVNRLNESLPPLTKIEVEVTNLDELHEAVAAGADLVLLDNMSPKEMEMAVRSVQGKVLLEASGNVTLDNISKIAATGVDFISSSAMVHSSSWSDLSLLFELQKK